MNKPILKNLTSCTTLANGVKMPWIGLGTAGTWTPHHKSSEGTAMLGSDKGVAEAVSTALDFGYRHIDTASFYGNEEAVGRAIASHPVDREQVFITTKVWNDDIAAGTDATRASVKSSLKRLGADAVDLLMLHWPVKGWPEAWQVLETYYMKGKARAIGVSNFDISHLEELFSNASVIPMVNQVEFHPYLQQPVLFQFCLDHGIQHQGWSPLMVGNIVDVKEIVQIAGEHGKTPAQVAIRWALQRGSVTIPKSSNRHRIEENADVFDFELSAKEMRTISRLDRNRRIGPDPQTFPTNWD
jgi:methylglyoxal/glyoxal reductase